MEENKKETKPVESTEEKKVEAKVEETKKEVKEETKTKKEETKKENKKQEAPKTANTTNKKVEATKSKKENNKKSNNNGMIIGVAVAAIVIVAIIVGMVMMKDSPKKAVENNFRELKTEAYAQKMLAGIMQGEGNIEAEAQKLFFEKLQWKILNEKEEGETATVEVEVTNKDFKTIMTNCMQKILKSTVTGNEDERSNYLMEELRNEQVQTVTNTYTMTLQKQNGKWEITDLETYRKAILPGLYETISLFN